MSKMHDKLAERLYHLHDELDPDNSAEFVELLEQCAPGRDVDEQVLAIATYTKFMNFGGNLVDFGKRFWMFIQTSRYIAYLDAGSMTEDDVLLAILIDDTYHGIHLTIP